MLVVPVPLAPGIGAWFTGRDRDRVDPPVGAAGNLSHHRPHLPGELAHQRATAGAQMSLDPAGIHLMRQVHGREVAVVTAATPPGTEQRGVDALVTTEPDRPLAVQVADCVPVLLAGPGVVAAVHAGRRGVAVGVVPAALATIEQLGVAPDRLSAVVGPAIGGCCYEVPSDLRAAIGTEHPRAVSTTTWGTPSLDLPAAVTAVLAAAGVTVTRSGGCTHCDDRWFSHRRDPDTGRQVGVVVRYHDPALDGPVPSRGGAAEAVA